MYAAFDDPYCYRGTAVLKNRLALRDQDALDAFEAEATAQRFSEPLPHGRFSETHYRAIHRHIFGDVYAWAGRSRSVRIAKGGSMFCYPEHIPAEMRRVFAGLARDSFLRGLDARAFARGAAHFLAELNAIHPFRDGNGRAQMAFMAALAIEAGHPLNLRRLDHEKWLAAMIRSFAGHELALVRQLGRLIEP